MSDEAAPPPLDTATVFRNIVQDLQVNPQYYKRFGIYWWPVKALLRRAGYSAANLSLLGTYYDPVTAAMVPHLGLDGTLRAALEEYNQNAAFPHPDQAVENADGELVRIVDEDAGF
jgi:hypothetical protein